jgi:hypothetical protein
MLQSLLNKIDEHSKAIKAERESMSNAIANSDLIEQIVDNVILGKDSSELMIEFFRKAEVEYETEYNQIADQAEKVALTNVRVISKNN